MQQEFSSDDLQALRRAYERVSEHGWGVALGLLAALGLFIATVVLVVKGGPSPGFHLQLLRAYLPGYRVTWPGAFLGGLYMFALGYLAGRTIGTLYNRAIRSSARPDHHQ
jgi:hypothetical protein